MAVVLQRFHEERAKLGVIRDNFRAIQEDAKELAVNAEEAIAHIDEAIDILSRYT